MPSPRQALQKAFGDVRGQHVAHVVAEKHLRRRRQTLEIPGVEVDEDAIGGQHEDPVRQRAQDRAVRASASLRAVMSSATESTQRRPSKSSVSAE